MKKLIKGQVVTVVTTDGLYGVETSKRTIEKYGNKSIRFVGFDYRYETDETLISFNELSKRSGSMPLCIISDELSIEQYTNINTIRIDSVRKSV